LPLLRCHVFRGRPHNTTILQHKTGLERTIWMGFQYLLESTNQFSSPPLQISNLLLPMLMKLCHCSNQTVCLLQMCATIIAQSHFQLVTHARQQGGAIGSSLDYYKIESRGQMFQAPMWFPYLNAVHPIFQSLIYSPLPYDRSINYQVICDDMRATYQLLIQTHAAMYRSWISFF
jgi:hypothetical protein